MFKIIKPSLEGLDPVLNLFVRDDMPFSMNPGRAAAQMSHATSVFHKRMEELRPTEDSTSSLDWIIPLYDRWISQTPYGYGTVIVRTMSLEEMYSWEALAEAQNFYGEVIIDPEYKFKDGAHIFTSTDVPTGLVLFGSELSPYASKLREYPFYG